MKIQYKDELRLASDTNDEKILLQQPDLRIYQSMDAE